MPCTVSPSHACAARCACVVAADQLSAVLRKAELLLPFLQAAMAFGDEIVQFDMAVSSQLLVPSFQARVVREPVQAVPLQLCPRW